MATSTSALTAAAPSALDGMIPRPESAAFLALAGWENARISPLAGDASFRRYFRVDATKSGAPVHAVLMDAPPPNEDTRPFMYMTHWLRGAGFAAPEIFAADEGQGFLLIEDFGDRVVAPELAAGRADEIATYGQAIDILVALHRSGAPDGLPGYGREILLREAMLLPEWYGPAAGLDVDGEAYVAAWDAVWQSTLHQTNARPVVTLRDYHAENLLLLDRTGIQSLGLLDFQDALAGHPAYDLVSLLQDARRTVSPELENRMIDRYVAAMGVEDAAGFRASYEILGAQRNSKILGIFVRLRDRDGRTGYVERLPRVWTCLERNLAHPALAPVRAWFDTNIPPSQRSHLWR